MRSVVCAGAMVALLLAPLSSWAQTAPSASSAAPPTSSAAAPAEPAHVDGFRSAKWGMTAAQVKAAIRSDFNIPEDKIKTSENLGEKTQVLTITVPDLLEGAGAAQVSYIFGYTSKKLIQINVLWGTAVDPTIAADKIVAAADQLRLLFLESGYEAQSIVANAKMADGTILVFQGQDSDKHTTLLRLAVAAAQPAGKQQKPAETSTLSLSYVLDIHEPDIYRVKKGLF